MPFPQLAVSALSCLEISEPLTSKKGQKYCNIFFNGEQPLWQLSGETLYSPWQAGVYQKDSATETRQNLDLHLTEEARTVAVRSIFVYLAKRRAVSYSCWIQDKRFRNKVRYILHP